MRSPPQNFTETIIPGSQQGQFTPLPPPANSAANTERVAGQLQGTQAADAAAFGEEQSALAKPMSALAGMPPAPQPPQMKQPEKAPDHAAYQKDAMAWASAMAVLGAVAGRFARVPGTAALSAFGAAMKGWQTGNQQAYENAAKEWEQNTKTTVENNRQVLEKYKLALENRKMNIDEQMSQIQLISAQYHDKMMYDASAAKNYTMVAQIYEKQFEYTDKVKQSGDALQQKREDQRVKNEQQAAYWLSPDGQTKLATLPPGQQAAVKQLISIYAAKTGGLLGSDPSEPGGGGQMSDQSIAGRAKLYAAGDLDGAFKGVGGGMAGSRVRNMITNRGEALVAEQGTDLSAKRQEYKAHQVGLSAEERTGATTAANLDIIMRNAHAAIPQAVAASEKVPRTSWMPLNRLMQTADSGISDPALKEFKLANLQLAELWARAMNPKGVMRESDRELALQMLSTADSPETYRRVTKQLEVFLERERAAVKEFREHREPGSTSGAPSPSSPSAQPAPPDPAGDHGWTIEKVH
jgi:hypothetical protein